MKPFKELTESENEALLKFPAYISLLAANNDNKLDETEKKSAVKFSHVKTYSCNLLLAQFYLESDKLFETNIERLNNELPKETVVREAALKTEIMKLEKIVVKLGKAYAEIVHRSMNSFKEHVSKAHHSVLADFVIPMPVKGITYQ